MEGEKPEEKIEEKRSRKPSANTNAYKLRWANHKIEKLEGEIVALKESHKDYEELKKKFSKIELSLEVAQWISKQKIPKIDLLTRQGVSRILTFRKRYPSEIKYPSLDAEIKMMIKVKEKLEKDLVASVTNNKK